jgi:transposase
MVPRLTLEQQADVQHGCYNKALVFHYDHGRSALVIDKKVTPKKVYLINTNVAGDVSATCKYTGESITFSKTEKVDHRTVNMAHKRVRAKQAERTLNNLFDVVMTPESNIKELQQLKKLDVKMAFMEAEEILKQEPTKECLVILTRTKRKTIPTASVRFIEHRDIIEDRDIEVDCFTADKYR